MRCGYAYSNNILNSMQPKDGELEDRWVWGNLFLPRDMLSETLICLFLSLPHVSNQLTIVGWSGRCCIIWNLKGNASA